MKKILMAGLASVMAMVAAPSSAAVFTIAGSPFVGDFSATFGNSSKLPGSINDTFNFVVSPAGVTTSSVISIAQLTKDIVLTSVKLDGTAFTCSSGPIDMCTLNATNLSAGAHAIVVLGKWDKKGGSYGGQIDFTVADVPEPATWGLMLVGFGVTGAALRRRNSLVARIA